MQNAKAEWLTSWNQDCQEKYQHLRYADNTTLMTENEGTKESLDEGERGEWKNWLKTHY